MFCLNNVTAFITDPEPLLFYLKLLVSHGISTIITPTVIESHGLNINFYKKIIIPSKDFL